MREAGRIVGQVLEQLQAMAKPGVTALDLDTVAEEFIRSHGGKPAFKGYQMPGRSPFPATICASINDGVVHGIPDGQTLAPGDLISVDVGVEYQGFFGDTATTISIGPVSDKAAKLMQVCREALDLAIEQMRPGNALCKIGETVEDHVEANGFSVVRALVGHGIGTELHQAPEVPHFKTKRYPEFLMEPGLVLAIEPMINAGGCRVTDTPGEWPVRTADGKLSAHFEHTVAVTPGGHEILTLP
jgi:methionyl aminopeptidase